MDLSAIVKSLKLENDDDKYVHIGYGKYKQKGHEDDENAPSFSKTDGGKYVKAGDDAGDDKASKPGMDIDPTGGLGGDDGEKDDYAYDDETNDRIKARNKPHSADAFFDNPYADSEPSDMDTDEPEDEPEDEPKDDEEDDYAYDDETNDRIKARNNPHMHYYETIQINGKKYRPIKESKKEKTSDETLKEQYDRLFTNRTVI
jgi:hypothetical protein